MTEQEQIEEIAAYVKSCHDVSCIGCKFFKEEDCSRLFRAEALYNAGYHKTTWHKVADGDLPKEKQNVLIAFKGFQTNKIVVISGFYLNGDFMNENSSKIRKDHIIAWTELPEYKEVKKMTKITREELQELNEWYNEYAHNDIDEYEEDEESLEEYEQKEYFKNI